MTVVLKHLFKFFPLIIIYKLTINEYLSKSDQNLVHCLSCRAVRRTAHLNFCSGRMLKSLGLEVEP